MSALPSIGMRTTSKPPATASQQRYDNHFRRKFHPEQRTTLKALTIRRPSTWLRAFWTAASRLGIGVIHIASRTMVSSPSDSQDHITSSHCCLSVSSLLGSSLLDRRALSSQLQVSLRVLFLTVRGHRMASGCCSDDEYSFQPFHLNFPLSSLLVLSIFPCINILYQ